MGNVWDTQKSGFVGYNEVKQYNWYESIFWHLSILKPTIYSNENVQFYNELKQTIKKLFKLRF